VINLSGANILAMGQFFTDSYKMTCVTSRVESTNSLLDLIKSTPDAEKPDVFVCTSAVGRYPVHTSLKYDEFTPDSKLSNTVDSFAVSLCQKIENAADRLLAEEVNSEDDETKLITSKKNSVDSKSAKTRLVKMRMGVAMGKEGGFIAQVKTPIYFGVGTWLGSGEQFLPWIHIDDAVGLYIHALTNSDVSGPLNAVGPEITTSKAFMKALAAAMNRPMWFGLPTFALKLFFAPERIELLAEGQCVIPTKALQTGYKFQHESVLSAVTNLSK